VFLLAVIGFLHRDVAAVERRPDDLDGAEPALALFQLVESLEVDLDSEDLIEAPEIGGTTLVVGIYVLATGVEAVGGIDDLLAKDPALGALQLFGQFQQ
jgi:hypothetical protein